MMKMQHLKLPPKNTNLKCTVLEIIPAFVLPHFYHTCVLTSSKRPSSSFREMLKLSQIQYSVLQKMLQFKDILIVGLSYLVASF